MQVSNRVTKPGLGGKLLEEVKFGLRFERYVEITQVSLNVTSFTRPSLIKQSRVAFQSLSYSVTFIFIMAFITTWYLLIIFCLFSVSIWYSINKYLINYVCEEVGRSLQAEGKELKGLEVQGGWKKANFWLEHGEQKECHQIGLEK